MRTKIEPGSGMTVCTGCGFASDDPTTFLQHFCDYTDRAGDPSVHGLSRAFAELFGPIYIGYGIPPVENLLPMYVRAAAENWSRERLDRETRRVLGLELPTVRAYERAVCQAERAKEEAAIIGAAPIDRGALLQATADLAREQERDRVREVLQWTPLQQALAYQLLQDVAKMDRAKADKLLRDAGLL